MRKAQHKGKRVLASALCVGMLASMVPTQAFAADEQPVAAVVQEAAPAAEEAPAEDAVSTETPAEESAAEETPAPAEDAPTEETPVEEAPAEEAALAPMDAPVEEALAAEETAAPAAQEAAAPQTAAARIATNVGVVPAGIDWADNVTANTFAEPYATVTAKDKAGNEYTVEVIPADTVYFIDSVAATGNDKMDNVQSTAAYAAAKALLGDQLLNGKSDQFYQGDATWGLVDTDAQTKGYTSSNADDKDYTGVYGKNNEAGETISYKFTLPAGKYKITTAHREWWGGQNRAMDLSLTTDAGTSVYASVPKQDNNAVTTKTGEFEITSEKVVTWTATTTGQHAPAVSWLAVERTGDAETPDTPVDGDNANFGKALEDNDMVSVRTGASLVESLNSGKQVSVTSGWISGGEWRRIDYECGEHAQTRVFLAPKPLPEHELNALAQEPAIRLRNLLELGLPEHDVYLVHTTADVGWVPAAELTQLSDRGKEQFAELLDAKVSAVRPGPYGTELVLDGVDPQLLVQYDQAIADCARAESAMKLFM